MLPRLKDHIERSAQAHDPIALALLRSVPGIGHILALVILYEIERVARFARVQDFLSYCRLVKPMLGNRPARCMGLPARRSAMYISSGHSRKRQSPSCAAIGKGKP
jgi:transposase